MTQEEILKQGRPIKPNSFETEREKQWYKIGLYEGATASSWHSVADGDLPKGIKNNSECMPFIVKTKGGSQHLAYYAGWLDEEYRAIRYDFFDDYDCLLDVEYWMEIPELPK